MKKQTKEKQGFTVNAIASLTGIDRRTLAKRLADVQPVARHGGQRLYSAQDALRAARPTRPPAISPELAAVLLDRARDKARQEKVKADEAEKLSLNAEAVRLTATRFALALKFKCIAMCTSSATRLALMTDPIEVTKHLYGALREIFESVRFDFGYVACPHCKKEIAKYPSHYENKN